MKIAFHGQRGSYAEAAAAWMYAAQDIATMPCPTVQAVLDAIADGTCQHGVVRVENTEWGPNVEVMNMLRQARVYFSREIRFHERYNLAGQREATTADIKRVYANPTILSLCSIYMSRLPKVDIIARYDSAESMAGLIRRGKKEEATVCGDFAAAVFGLKVLQPGVENSVSSMTRFVSLSGAKTHPPEDARSVSTAVLFELKHQPGALMEALAAFRNHGINLSTVSAWPKRNDQWDYATFVEFKGRYDDPDIMRALAELREHTTHLQLLGSYDSAEPRL